MAESYLEFIRRRREEEEELAGQTQPSLLDTPPAEEGGLAGFFNKFREEASESTGLETQTPLTLDTPGQLASGVVELGKSQLKKSPMEFLGDVAKAPFSMARSALAHGAATLKTFADDPVEMIPFGLETLAGVSSLFVPGLAPFALPISMAGRALGEGAVGLIKGINPFTVENTAELAFGPARFLMGAGVATGAVKGALREGAKAGAKEGLASKVANFLDLQKLGLPQERGLADTLVKSMESQVTPEQMRTYEHMDYMQRWRQGEQRASELNLMPTKQLKKHLADLDAADQVLKLNPEDYTGKVVGPLAAEVRKEVDRRAQFGEYMKAVDNHRNLSDLATIQGGILDLDLLPVPKDIKAKAAADPNFHKKLTSDFLEDLANDMHPEFMPGVMEKKYGKVDLDLARQAQLNREMIDREAGRSLPAFEKDLKTGKLTPINTGDEVTDVVKRAFTEIQRGVFEPTQTAEVTRMTPFSEADAATMLGVSGPDVLPRFMKAIETVPNEKLTELSKQLRRQREFDRNARNTRRVNPEMVDEEVDKIFAQLEEFRDQEKIKSRTRGLKQEGEAALRTVTDLVQKDSRTALLEYLKKDSMKGWEEAQEKLNNYEAELLQATPEAARKALASKWHDPVNDAQQLRIMSQHTAGNALLDGQDAVLKDFTSNMGITPSIWDPQWLLAKDNNPYLKFIGSLLKHADYTKENIVSTLSKKGAQIFTKHGVDKGWNDYLMQVQRHPEFLEKGMQAVKGLAPEEQQAAVRKLLEGGIPSRYGAMGTPVKLPKFDEADIPMFAKTLDFAQDFMENIRTPTFAIAKELNMDPKDLAVFMRNQLFPTTVTESELKGLEDNIKRVTDGMQKLIDSGEKQETSAPLARYAEVLENLNRRKAIATDQMGKVGKAMSESAQLYDDHGVATARVRNPAAFEKNTDLLFGADPYHAWLSSLDQTVGKSIYDQALPAADRNLAAFMKQYGTNDKTRGVQRWVHDLILDQTGTRKNHEYDKITTALNRGGIPIKADTLKKSVGAVNTMRYVLDIAMNARFYPMQMMQNALFLMPLVGIEAFTHGLGKIFKPGAWKEAAEEAMAVGAVSGDVPKLFLEDTPQKMLAAAEKAGTLVQFTEKMNRVQAYHAGKKNALDNGLSEEEAVKHGLNVVRDTNFFMTPANRPTATNTPVGSMLMRYRTFSNNYATFLAKHIRAKNWDVVSSSLGVLTAMSGTYGIPLYGMVQSALATQGINMPNISPPDEVFGTSIGGAGSALPGLPLSAQSLAGPVLSPLVALSEGATAKEAAAMFGQKIVGRPAAQMAQAIAELTRRGVTRTPGGDLKVRRTIPRILESAFNFAPSAQNEVRGARHDIQRMVEAGDTSSLSSYLANLKEKGARLNRRELLSQSRSSVKRQRNQSFGDLLLGG